MMLMKMMMMMMMMRLRGACWAPVGLQAPLGLIIITSIHHHPPSSIIIHHFLYPPHLGDLPLQAPGRPWPEGYRLQCDRAGGARTFPGVTRETSRGEGELKVGPGMRPRNKAFARARYPSGATIPLMTPTGPPLCVAWAASSPQMHGPVAVGWGA